MYLLYSTHVSMYIQNDYSGIFILPGIFVHKKLQLKQQWHEEEILHEIVVTGTNE